MKLDWLVKDMVVGLDLDKVLRSHKVSNIKVNFFKKNYEISMNVYKIYFEERKEIIKKIKNYFQERRIRYKDLVFNFNPIKEFYSDPKILAKLIEERYTRGESLNRVIYSFFKRIDPNLVLGIMIIVSGKMGKQRKSRKVFQQGYMKRSGNFKNLIESVNWDMVFKQGKINLNVNLFKSSILVSNQIMKGKLEEESIEDLGEEMVGKENGK